MGPLRIEAIWSNNFVTKVLDSEGNVLETNVAALLDSDSRRKHVLLGSMMGVWCRAEPATAAKKLGGPWQVKTERP
jgi:hypothetical protein